jgi:diguanylate cyclase (GGDEF)-like protein/PAS domain S-box-containing protein
MSTNRSLSRMSETAREAGERRERSLGAFEEAAIGMGVLDLDGRWLQVNAALCEITGLSRRVLMATPLEAITHRDDVDLDLEQRVQLVSGRTRNFSVEKRLYARGQEVWVQVTASLVHDDAREPLHLVLQVQDISDRKAKAAQADYLMDHDALTGLFNRRRFDQELLQQVEMAARYGSGGAVLMVDLDHFKQVNDSFGHKAGDDLLRAVGAELRRRTRKTDVVARLGGDEFAVLLPQVNLEQATVVAEAIVKGVRQHSAVLAEKSIPMTASVGVVLFDDLTDAQLLAYADQAMFQAKEAGRDRLAVYRAGVVGRRTPGRLDEAARLRKGLAEDRLTLHAQPIVEVPGGTVSQFELLVRLQDEVSGELLMPGAFLYVAERFDMIQEIDRWVVDHAVSIIAEHAAKGRALLLEINLSGKSIGDLALAAFTEERITMSGIDPRSLIFELTETAAIANLEDAQRFAERLRRLGCRFALDDFGSGFGSFYYLKHLPFDFIKIDGDFIRGLAASHTDQLVVEAIVTIARGMGKQTIAEFVTDQATVDLLGSAGVDFAQGFHIGRPGPLREMLEFAGAPASRLS